MESLMQNFKKLTVFGIAEGTKLDLETIEQAMQAQAFVPGGAQAERSTGWAAPREEAHAPFIEAIAGHWLATYVIETRSVPKEVVEKKLVAWIEAFEHECGRAPGRKEQRQMRADVLTSLMPNALTRTEKIAVWIDPTAKTVGIAATAQTKTDSVVTGLVRAIEDFAVVHRTDQGMIVAAMREWLMLDHDEAMPSDITLGNECVLKALDESQAVANFTKQAVSCDEVRQSLKAGKMPLRLELVFGKHLSLVLCANGALKKIRFEDAFLMNKHDHQKGDLDGGFTIFATEMAKTLSDLQAAIQLTIDNVKLSQDASIRAMQGIAGMWQHKEAPAAVLA